MQSTPRLRPASLLVLLSAIALAMVAGLLRVSRPMLAKPESAPLRAGIDMTLARDDRGCAGVRTTVWHPLSGLDYTGRLRVRLPARAGGRIVFFVGDSVPLDIAAESLDGRPVVLRQERLPPGPGVDVPPDFWLEHETPWSAPRHIVRGSVEALPLRDLDFRLSLGRRAPQVLARLVDYPSETRVPVCAEHVGERDVYFASGWYGEENGDFGPLRWMRQYGAVLLPSPDGRAVRVRIRAAPAILSTESADTVLTLRVNDFLELAPVPMQRAFADYEWDVPDAAWVPGTNELFFRVSQTVTRGTRTLGLALASITAR